MVVVTSCAAGLVPTSHALAAPSGAGFTTVNESVDGSGHCANGNPGVNCNIYDGKQYVWLNGGPSANQLLPDGQYFFAALVPGGQPNPNDGASRNLSDGPYGAYTDRTFTVTNGEISAYSGSHDFDPTADPPLIRLLPYDNTTNSGGVYILAICSLAGGYPVAPSSCKYDAFKIRADTEPPECPRPTVGINSGGKKYMTQTIQDAGGMDHYHVLQATNVTLKVENYFLGTAGKIKVTGTKVNQSKTAVVRIRFFDVAGNSRVCDPVLTDLRVPVRGDAVRPVVQVFTGVSSDEHRVTVRNGRPGLSSVELLVNRRRYALHSLRAGQTRTVDIRGALRPGRNNRIVLRGIGKRGAIATVVISN